ncbi:MAG: hypothetical protein NT158_05890, partial [Cyanobacteria bacterium]|nr:hypothetical protein [Cyanobacteriota bacterium]
NSTYDLILGNIGADLLPELIAVFNLPSYVRYDNLDNNTSPGNTLRFTPLATASVPSPLPLFGAAAAYGWSRQLRRRIKTSV